MSSSRIRTQLKAVIPALLLFALLAVDVQAQQAILEGTITDADTGLPLQNANVFLPGLTIGATTNEEGFYRLDVVTGTHEVRYSFIGYDTQEHDIDINDTTTFDVALVADAELGQVDVFGDREADVDAPILGVSRLEVRELERLPLLMGEVDVSRALLTLPGVTTVGEGSSGLHVRGGEADQNLILLDGVEIFFPSHLFGMFSAFNPDLLESITLYRGTIPARYGGRISSVVNVRQRDGAADRLRLSAGLGLISSRVAVEGPLLGEHLTAIVGARLSHVNWLLGLANRADVQQSDAGYADLTTRVTFRPTDRLQMRLSGYYGYDSFRFGADTTYTYASAGLALRSTYAASERATAMLEVAFSNYDYGFDSEDPVRGFQFGASINHLRAQPSLLWQAPSGPMEEVVVEVGAAFDKYRISPARLSPLDPMGVAAVHLDDEHGIDAAAYLSVDAEWGRFRVDAGVRYSHWMSLGPGMVPVIDPMAPRGPASVVDTIMVASGEIASTHAGLEPRLGLRYSLSEGSALKAGFSRLRQNVHLLSNTTAPTPVARWTLSDPNIPSQVSDQVNLGIQSMLPFDVEMTLEGYYRWLYDVPTYRPGASLLLNPFVAADLLTGDGRAYGAELLLERSGQSVSAQLTYALSKTERRAFSPRPEEQVNQGNYFPADFDRPHDFGLMLSYNESSWVTWGLNFVYSSGRPMTQPTGVYDLGGMVVPVYTERNQARLPAYHRLDLSLTIDAPSQPTGRFRGRWNVTLYNVYGRRNAYSVFFRQQPGTRIPQAYRISTFGTIMPSISYALEF